MDYHTSQAHFERLFAQTKRTHTFLAETPQACGAWAGSLRARLRALTGIDTMESCPPQPEIVERTPCAGYERRKILIHTEPDVVMPFYMLVPDDLAPGAQRTAVIACHGHSSNGKSAVAGVRTQACVADRIDHYSYNYGEVLAQQGYIVFAPDARGFGERRERYDQGDAADALLGSSCAYLNAMAISLGQTVTGMWTWDLMRLADFALACPEVNGHLACVGLSGGGLQSLWLSALDPRVECSVVSGYFYGYLESLLINHNCACNYVPNLWSVADIGDIGALIAPRPLLVETGDADDLNGKSGLANVSAPLATVQKAMDLYGKPDHLFHDVFAGGHKWHGTEAYQWLQRHAPAVWHDDAAPKKEANK